MVGFLLGDGLKNEEGGEGKKAKGRAHDPFNLFLLFAALTTFGPLLLVAWKS